jgi:3-phytase
VNFFAAVFATLSLLPVSLCFAKMSAPSLTAEAIALIPGSEKFQKTLVGGLSALTYHADHVLLLSDDRGKVNDPRFYESELIFKDGKLELKISAVRFIKDLPGLKDHSVVVDPEGLARLGDGSLLISSEADTNRKPREKNRIMKFSAAGSYLEDIPVPEDLQGEPTGLQKKGSQGNYGLEGLSLTPAGDFLWAAAERALVQEPNRRRLRFDRYKLGDHGKFQLDKTVSYIADEAVEGSREVLRGVSAILALDADHLLVIERSAVFLPAKILGYGGGIFFANCQKDPCEKTLVLDFEMDLGKIRESRGVANFEGLSWGPLKSDGTKTVLLLSDNNLSRSVATELLIFSFKEKSP